MASVPPMQMTAAQSKADRKTVTQSHGATGVQGDSQAGWAASGSDSRNADQLAARCASTGPGTIDRAGSSANRFWTILGAELNTSGGPRGRDRRIKEDSRVRVLSRSRKAWEKQGCSAQEVHREKLRIVAPPVIRGRLSPFVRSRPPWHSPWGPFSFLPVEMPVTR